MNAASGAQKSHLFPGAVWACLVFGLTVGLLDLIVGLLRMPPGLDRFIFVLPPLAATTLAGLLFAAAVLVVVGTVERVLGATPLSWVTAVLTYLAVLFAVVSMAYLLPTSVLPENTSMGDYLLKCGLLAALCAPALPGAYFLARRAAETSGRGRSPASLSFAIPWILSATLVLVWLEKYRIDAFLSPESMKAALACGAVSLAAVALCYLLGHRPWFRGSLGLLAAAVLLGPVATVLFEARRPAAPPAADAEKPIPSVILIVVDTLRDDFLTCHNPDALPTPCIDQLARDGVLFRNAVSPSPWTVPAMASMMAGVSPLAHRMNSFGARLPDEFMTLGECMREAGYATGGIGHNGNLGARMNFDQGFDTYDWFPKPEFDEVCFGSSVLRRLLGDRFAATASTPHLIRLATDWVGRHREAASFLWLHVYDPHQPYTPPPEFLPAGEPPEGMERRFATADVRRAMRGYLGQTAAERDWTRALYNGEVQYVDECLGRLFEQLRAWGVYEQSLIVFTSDHGEEFWEHGGFEHGQSLYRELLHVPLIVKPPRSATASAGEPSVVETVVSTESIMATILELCGIDYDHNRLSAPSLAGLCRAQPPQGPVEQPIVSAGLLRGDHREAVTHGKTKYILSLATGHEEFYRHDEDPQEQINAADGEAGRVAAAREALAGGHAEAAALRAATGLPDDEQPTPVDDSTQELLRAVGYLD